MKCIVLYHYFSSVRQSHLFFITIVFPNGWKALLLCDTKVRDDSEILIWCFLTVKGHTCVHVLAFFCSCSDVYNIKQDPSVYHSTHSNSNFSLSLQPNFLPCDWFILCARNPPHPTPISYSCPCCCVCLILLFPFLFRSWLYVYAGCPNPVPPICNPTFPVKFSMILPFSALNLVRNIALYSEFPEHFIFAFLTN